MTTPFRFVLAATTLLALTAVVRAQDVFDAMNRGDLAGLAKMLKDDPKLANKPKTGELPLNYALRGNNFKIVELLVDAGADVNGIDANGVSPTHYAAGNRNKAMLDLLIAKGAKLELLNKNNGMTPLFLAAREGHRDNIALLLEKGALIDGGFHPKQSQPPWTPLYEAVGGGHIRTVEFLLRKGANPNLKGLHGGPLDKATETRDKDMIHLLLAHGVNVHSDKAFIEALQAGERDLVNLYLQRGIDAKKPEYLQHAAWKSKEMVELLLDRGANPRDLDSAKRNALWMAASKGDANTIALLLARGADAKNADSGLMTPLHHAANATVAELLIANGADVNAVARDGTTPLHAALTRGDKQLLECLVKRKAKVDAFSLAALGRADELRKYLQDRPIPKPLHEYQLSPLHLAARYGQNDTLAVLLEKGADVNSKAWDERTPLHVAAEYGHKTTAEFLLKKNADINAKTTGNTFGTPKQTPLQLALENGRVEVVRLLVEKGATPKMEGAFEKACWMGAAERKDLALLRYFLERGMPIDVELGQTPLSPVRLAAEKGDLEALKELVAKGADLKKKSAAGDTPLRAAVRGQSKAIVEYLLERGGDPRDPTSLGNAVYQGNTDIVELLLSKGADIHQREAFDDTGLLRIAVQGNQPDTLKLLLAKGADVKKEPLALHLAAKLGHKPLVETLLAAGADIEAISKPGKAFNLYYWTLQKRLDVLEFFLDPSLSRPPSDWNGLQSGTPLHAAAAGRQKDVVALLLSKGAKVDAKLPSGGTALHLAAYLGDRELAKVLLDYKADVKAKDAAGLTAVKLAEREGRVEMATLLRKEGAK